MFVPKMSRTLSMACYSIALLLLVGLGGCATLSKEDRALLESSKQSAEEAKAAAARAEAAAKRLEEMGIAHGGVVDAHQPPLLVLAAQQVLVDALEVLVWLTADECLHSYRVVPEGQQRVGGQLALAGQRDDHPGQPPEERRGTLLAELAAERQDGKADGRGGDEV